jgi:uncharacterized membrane protein
VVLGNITDNRPNDQGIFQMIIFKFILAALMIFAGVAHFRQPQSFVRIVPDYLPSPRLLVYISGVFEILGGLGLVVPLTQKWAAWGLIALFIAVFPANVNMALEKIPFGSLPTPQWMLWLRLPLQGVIIYWAYVYTL